MKAVSLLLSVLSFECNHYLDTLRQGVADSELGHIVLLVSQADEIIVYARLVFSGIIEVEVFLLDIVNTQLLCLEFRNVFEKSLLLSYGHTPYHNGAIVEQEYFGCMDMGVKIWVDRCIRRYSISKRCCSQDVTIIWIGGWCHRLVLDIDEMLWSWFARLFNLYSTVGVPSRSSPMRCGIYLSIKTLTRFTLIRKVAIWCIDAFVEELRCRPSRSPATTQELHDVV